jgi:hypothetical protein
MVILKMEGSSIAVRIPSRFSVQKEEPECLMIRNSPDTLAFEVDHHET